MMFSTSNRKLQLSEPGCSSESLSLGEAMAHREVAPQIVDTRCLAGGLVISRRFSAGDCDMLY